MAQNLTVNEGTTVLLNESPPAHLAESMQQVNIRTLRDLVDNGVVSSDQSLDRLLQAAKSATAEALSRRETFTPFVAVFGTSRPDLRRFGAYRVATGDGHPAETQAFWRVARTIDASAMAGITLDTDLSSVTTRVSPAFSSAITKYLFQDVIVEANATLAIAPSVHLLTCGDLLIKKTGRILVQGGVKIVAHSIKGEQ